MIREKKIIQNKKGGGMSIFLMIVIAAILIILFFHKPAETLIEKLNEKAEKISFCALKKGGEK